MTPITTRLNTKCPKCGADEWYSRWRCAVCLRAQARKRYAANRKLLSSRRVRSYHKNVTVETARKRTSRRENPIPEMLHRTRSRAKQAGMPFTLSLLDLYTVWPWDDKCPVSGRKLEVGNLDCGPSVDRINNLKGYTADNVAIISRRANALKRDGTAEEHAQIARYMQLNGQ